MPGLTRDQMAAIIEGGRSVLYNGNIITHKDQLPSEVDLAGNDPEAQGKATDNLHKQRAALDKMIAEAEAKKAHAAKAAEAEAKAKTKADHDEAKAHHDEEAESHSKKK